jgi:type IV secretory pathway VirB6-like protein
MEILRYIITVVCLLFAQAAVFGVIAFGYVAAAIAVMLGPIFIPFYIVPELEWLFWGWFKSLVQYAFYPVVANAYLFVLGISSSTLSMRIPRPMTAPGWRSSSIHW